MFLIDFLLFFVVLFLQRNKQMARDKAMLQRIKNAKLNAQFQGNVQGMHQQMNDYGNHYNQPGQDMNNQMQFGMNNQPMMQNINIQNIPHQQQNQMFMQQQMQQQNSQIYVQQQQVQQQIPPHMLDMQQPPHTQPQSRRVLYNDDVNINNKRQQQQTRSRLNEKNHNNQYGRNQINGMIDPSINHPNEQYVNFSNMQQMNWNGGGVGGGMNNNAANNQTINSMGNRFQRYGDYVNNNTTNNIRNNAKYKQQSTVSNGIGTINNNGVIQPQTHLNVNEPQYTINNNTVIVNQMNLHNNKNNENTRERPRSSRNENKRGRKNGRTNTKTFQKWKVGDVVVYQREKMRIKDILFDTYPPRALLSRSNGETEITQFTKIKLYNSSYDRISSSGSPNEPRLVSASMAKSTQILEANRNQQQQQPGSMDSNNNNNNNGNREMLSKLNRMYPYNSKSEQIKECRDQAVKLGFDGDMIDRELMLFLDVVKVSGHSLNPECFLNYLCEAICQQEQQQNKK